MSESSEGGAASTDLLTRPKNIILDDIDQSTPGRNRNHLALYERKIAQFSQKYNLKMNHFLATKRRNIVAKSMQL